MKSNVWRMKEPVGDLTTCVHGAPLLYVKRVKLNVFFLEFLQDFS